MPLYGNINLVVEKNKRLHGQAVKTSPFHGGNTGSNPVGVILHINACIFLNVCNIYVMKDTCRYDMSVYSYYLYKYGDLAKW